MWIKLEKYSDEWGKHTYLTTKHKGYSRCVSGVKCEEGQKINIRWPDGTIEKHNVVYETQIEKFIHNDGHTSYIESKIAGITINIHGLNKYVCLDEIEVEMTDNGLRPPTITKY